jgi:hypothetical protein
MFARIARRAAEVYEGTTQDWASGSFILPRGTWGVDTTTGVRKLGDGVTAWGALAEFAQGPTGATGPAGPPGTQLTRYPTSYEAWLLAGSPAGTFRESVDRRLIGTNVSILTSGTLHVTALFLEAGEVVTNLTMRSGGTAASSPTNWWFALYDPAGNLIGQTPDQTTEAWGTTTTKTKALASPYTVPTSGLYRAGLMVRASTPPSLAGLSAPAGATAFVAGQLAVSLSVGGGALTTTAPATLSGAAGSTQIPYVIAH